MFRLVLQLLELILVRTIAQEYELHLSPYYVASSKLDISDGGTASANNRNYSNSRSTRQQWRCE
jgi:hypothetical protein